MFLYYRGVNPNVAVNGNVKFVDISERRSKKVKMPLLYRLFCFTSFTFIKCKKADLFIYIFICYEGKVREKNLGNTTLIVNIMRSAV